MGVNGHLSAAGAGTLLAVDAGNSKTDVAVLSGDGHVLGAARGGGFQPPLVGVATAVDGLAETVARACADAGVPTEFAHVTACLANADLPVEETALRDEVLSRGWSRSVRVHNDTFAVLRAGVDEPRGVAVVCGAGINCAGMTPDGRTARFPAIGKLSGDWGGGGGLAEEALWCAARGEDGRGEPTGLSRALPAHFGLETMYALIEALHLGRIPMERRHELAPVLFRVSAAGDPVALSLVHRLAEEVVAMASVVLGRLGLLDEPAPVLLGGSVLAARHPQLEERVRALLAVRAPKAAVGFVTAPPVLGAGLLALDETAAPVTAAARLREHYGV
ncbi:N-acetylglucosamine kinase [Streptomyces sp. NPDC088757]|uniref:N-acetylglucosamine kinase n=1 Tax=Streptomyces sp. NPDC088757 TaxID=3365889 RepID=UPI0037FC0796